MEGHTLVPILDYYERKEIGSHLKMLKSRINQLNFLLSFVLEWVRAYIDDHSLTMIGFIDWLSSK